MDYFPHIRNNIQYEISITLQNPTITTDLLSQRKQHKFFQSSPTQTYTLQFGFKTPKTNSWMRAAELYKLFWSYY